MTSYDQAFLDRLEARVEGFRPVPEFAADKFVVIALKEAIAAGREGNVILLAYLLS